MELTLSIDYYESIAGLGYDFAVELYDTIQRIGIPQGLDDRRE